MYPMLWKQEWVTAAPKVTNLNVIKDLRKISCTSDYSMLYEGFLMAAFDRQDPTLAIKKFIDLSVRPSIIHQLISYLLDKKMKVKFNGDKSDFLSLK